MRPLPLLFLILFCVCFQSHSTKLFELGMSASGPELLMTYTSRQYYMEKEGAGELPD